MVDERGGPRPEAALDDSSSGPSSRGLQETGGGPGSGGEHAKLRSGAPRSPTSRPGGDTEKTAPASRSSSQTSAAPPAAPRARPDVRAAVNQIDDRERLWGLTAAGLVVAITVAIVASYLAHPPRPHTTGYVARSTLLLYAGVRVALGLLVAVAALVRRRALLGFAVLFAGTSLGIGLAIPFWVLGAWLIWRALRAEREASAAQAAARTTDDRQRGAPRTRARTSTFEPGRPRPRPAPSKRYTPPKPKKRRSTTPGAGERRAGREASERAGAEAPKGAFARLLRRRAAHADA
jgi:hypothetical protein